MSSNNTLTEQMTIETLHIEGRLWFDRVNGNTYHSARATIGGVLQIGVPFQYGYGEQYVYSAQEKLAELGYLPIERHENGSVKPLWQEARDRGFTFTYNAEHVSKREAKAWGTLVEEVNQ